MININLDRIEAHLRQLFEKKLLQVVRAHQPQASFINNLIKVMRNNLRKDEDGQVYAPDLFMLEVPSNELNDWLVHQDILDEIIDSLHKIGLNESFIFLNVPTIHIQGNPNIPSHDFRIIASFSPDDPVLPDTAVMPSQEHDDVLSSIPENAAFILGGKTNVPLEKAVIDIGRHSSNDLILKNPHVSRHHAQLRAINDHYVIFDVGSTGGVFLNGRQIAQATLHAGDVIRLGTVNLIYIQDITAAHPTTAVPIDFNGDGVISS